GKPGGSPHRRKKCFKPSGAGSRKVEGDCRPCKGKGMATLFAAGQAASGATSVKVAGFADEVRRVMLRTKLKLAPAVLLAVSAVGAGGLLSYHAFATGPQEPSARPAAAVDEDVAKVLDKFRAARPDAKDLPVFRLDWAPTLKDAKARAA